MAATGVAPAANTGAGGSGAGSGEIITVDTQGSASAPQAGEAVELSSQEVALQELRNAMSAIQDLKDERARLDAVPTPPSIEEQLQAALREMEELRAENARLRASKRPASVAPPQPDRWRAHLDTLGAEEPRPMNNLGVGTQLAEIMQPPQNAPPNAPTPLEEQEHGGLSKALKDVLNQFNVPYHIWGRFARERLSTIQDLKNPIQRSRSD